MSVFVFFAIDTDEYPGRRSIALGTGGACCKETQNGSIIRCGIVACSKGIPCLVSMVIPRQEWTCAFRKQPFFWLWYKVCGVPR